MPPITVSPIPTYATDQWQLAAANWDILKSEGLVPGRLSNVDVVTIVDKIKTWIVSLIHNVSEHIHIVIHGIITLLNHHPYTALVISTLISFPGAILIPPILFCAVCTPVLACLGFCAEGVASGSIAAGFQGAYHGAAVPAGGLFATMQSLGATMNASIMIVLGSWVLIVPWLISCAVWIYVVFGILLH